MSIYYIIIIFIIIFIISSGSNKPQNTTPQNTIQNTTPQDTKQNTPPSNPLPDYSNVKTNLYLTPDATQSIVYPYQGGTSYTIDTTALPKLLVIQDDNYKKYIACGSKVTAFCGPRVALIIDEADWLTETKLPVALLFNSVQGLDVMGAVVAGLEKLISCFDSIVPNTPVVSAPYNGRSIRLECAYLGGAGGLAGHGTYNFAVGPAFIVQYINSIVNPNAYHLYQSSYWQLDNPVKFPLYYQHVIGYELCRNYIFPNIFTPVFQYGVNTDSRSANNTMGNVPSASIIVNTSSYGWINQSFVNILGLLLELDMNPSVGFNYNGYSYQWFMNYMMGHLQKYIEGGKSWSNTFLYEYMEWSPTNSLDNIYSGLLATLWGSYGRTAFLKNWFACLPNLPPTNGDYTIAADNYFIASCYGSQLNLSNYFINTLRWPITPATLSKIHILFGPPTNNMPTFSVPTQSIVKL